MTRSLAALIPPKGIRRTLALATVANNVGTGAFLTTLALYLTRTVGLPATTLGVGLTIAGIAGMLAGIPAGILADERGARGTAAALGALAGLATSLYLFIGSTTAFVAAAVVYAFFERGSVTARQTLVGVALTGAERVATRAYLRVMTNVGQAAGAGLASVALLVDTGLAYRAVIALNVLSFLVYAALLMRVPAVAPARSRGEHADRPRSLPVLRDHPYALLTALSAVLLLHAPLIDLILPLWISQHTTAPLWVVSAIVVVNTVTVVLLQVRISKGLEGLGAASTAMRRAGFALLVACVLFGGAGSRGAVLAVVLLLLGAVAHVLGEMIHSVASWTIAYDLAPEEHMGQYQGLFSSGEAATQVVAPALLTILVLGGGPVGWYVLGAIFLAAALASGPVIVWGERSFALRRGLAEEHGAG